MRRPFKNNRPLGPFVRFKTEDDERLSRCENVENISDSIEFIIPIDDATPEALINFPASDSELLQTVSSLDTGDIFLGIHETPKSNAKSIIDNGFSKERAGEMSVSESGIRENAVFTWQFIQNIGNEREDLAGVVVSAPKESVIVSDMSASVMYPKEVYLDDYTMSYTDYIECLSKSRYQAKIMGLEVDAGDLIQEL